jgi:hypothetical protein
MTRSEIDIPSGSALLDISEPFGGPAIRDRSVNKPDPQALAALKIRELRLAYWGCIRNGGFNSEKISRMGKMVREYSYPDLNTNGYTVPVVEKFLGILLVTPLVVDDHGAARMYNRPVDETPTTIFLKDLHLMQVMGVDQKPYAINPNTALQFFEARMRRVTGDNTCQVEGFLNQVIDECLEA